MILKAREPATFQTKLQNLVRPKKAYSRTLRYWGKRVLRIRATPHALALGVAIGVFFAFSPALGVHFLLAVGTAFALRANILAAGLATAAANPLTFPLMVAGDFEAGQAILGTSSKGDIGVGHLISQLSHLDFGPMWQTVFKPMFLGSIILGGIFALATYVVVYAAANSMALSRASRRRLKETMLP